ncbi:MAG: hypothetical protein SLAVMIC_00020 [uncultured marine phage]|uniref:Uncharacterized protein n=1 Tax=uncultured marine phage TaxID=707152 RepID=A0A8D9CAX7_9VIRU|nr:MAG: hypothetical protein SLAVMIC_00020 [uncultured marine phage]
MKHLKKINAETLKTFEKFNSEEKLEEGWKNTLMGALAALSLNFNSIAQDLDNFTIVDRDAIELSESQEMDLKKEIEKTEKNLKNLMEDFDSDTKYVADGILDKISQLDFDTVTAGEVASINNQVVQLIKNHETGFSGDISDTRLKDLLITCSNDIRNTDASVQTLIDDYHNLNAELNSINNHKVDSKERAVIAAQTLGGFASFFLLLILWRIAANKKRKRKERERETFSFTSRNRD